MNEFGELFYGNLGSLIAVLVLFIGLAIGITGKKLIISLLSRFAVKNWGIRILFIAGVFIGNTLRNDVSSITEGALIGCIASVIMLVIFLLKDVTFSRLFDVTDYDGYTVVRFKILSNKGKS